jgi:hypothetical protein
MNFSSGNDIVIALPPQQFLSFPTALEGICSEGLGAKMRELLPQFNELWFKQIFAAFYFRERSIEFLDQLGGRPVNDQNISLFDTIRN